MNNTARAEILATLRKGQKTTEAFPPRAEPWRAPDLSKEEKKEQFIKKLQNVFAVVITTKEQDLSSTLTSILQEYEIKKVAYGLNVWSTPTIESLSVEKLPYSSSIEELQSELFHGVDAGITTTKGGIAENGAMVLQPSPEEPRTLSLVPPLHIALVKEQDLFSSLAEVIETQNWNASMPTNTVLIASPSRTADIELVLAVGVHGPKKLIVVLIES